LFTAAQKGWSWLLTHAIVEAAKALGGSFKLVTLTPKTVREMNDSTAQGNIKGWDTNKSKNTNEYRKYQPRLNTQKNTRGPTGHQVV